MSAAPGRSQASSHRSPQGEGASVNSAPGRSQASSHRSPQGEGRLAPLQLWTRCRAATLRADATAPYGLINDAALVVRGDTLAWVGPRQALPPELAAQCTQTHDAEGALVTPGLIDCHTHLVHGGNRAQEFEQ
ncbi:MAG: hypothetical protein U1E02_25360, partial [Hydrogenophaga sp.]|nr:hypothetical protein [Hydrogenophaga sp.]